MSIAKQYNEFADDFSGSVDNSLVSRIQFYKVLKKIDLNEKSVLDAGCGDGIDLVHYEEQGAIVSGCDASEELIKIAQERLPEREIKVGLFEDLPFEDSQFDYVLSKYALQTSEDVETSVQEMIRVLKTNGELIFLTVHPLRQFMEKKSKHRDYYKQEKVGSVLFKGSIVAEEPSHTFSEYFSSSILEKLQLLEIYEGSDFSDTSAQQVNGDYYPTFLICRFKKII